MIDFIKFLIAASICGGLFSPLIAWRLKRGLNPMGIDNKTAGEHSYGYYFKTQLVFGFLGWPFLATCFYLVVLVQNGAYRILGGYFATAVFLLVLGLILIRSIRIKNTKDLD